MGKKKRNTIKWTCPQCKKKWVSTLKNIWFGRCYECGYSASFTKQTKKKNKWKYIKDNKYDDA